MRINTWADGFGRWHAAVEHTDESDEALQEAAHHAVREEIQARQGQPIGDHVTVALRGFSTNGTTTTSHYIEEVPDEDLR